MKHLALACLAFVALSLSAPHARAQASGVASCGGETIPPGYGNTYPTVDATGRLCDNGSGGSVIVNPVVVTPTDKSGTVTSGGTAQTAIALNTSRKGWCITNPPTATENLQVRSGAVATSTTGIAIAPGQQACNPPGLIDQGLISVLGATTSHAWLGVEYQ